MFCYRSLDFYDGHLQGEKENAKINTQDEKNRMDNKIIIKLTEGFFSTNCSRNESLSFCLYIRNEFLTSLSTVLIEAENKLISGEISNSNSDALCSHLDCQYLLPRFKQTHKSEDIAPKRAMGHKDVFEPTLNKPTANATFRAKK
jgi:hypothetical protein